MTRLVGSLALLALCALFAGCSPEEKLRSELKEANHCEEASDCVLIGSVCPFDCYIYVHKDEAEAMKTKLDAFETTCQYSCIASTGVECKEHKCSAITEISNRAQR